MVPSVPTLSLAGGALKEGGKKEGFLSLILALTSDVFSGHNIYSFNHPNSSCYLLSTYSDLRKSSKEVLNRSYMHLAFLDNL